MNSPLDINTKSSSNQTKTPNCDAADRCTSPVLSNTKKSSMRMAKYRSRKRLIGKFASSSSQDSVASFTDSESQPPLSPVLLESQVSGDFIDNNSNDIKARFKRIKEIQQQKKFCYNIAAKSNIKNCEINKQNYALDSSSSSTSNCCDNVNNLNKLNISDDNNESVCVGFNTVSGKKVLISKKKLKQYTDMLNEIKVEENDPMLQDTNTPKNILINKENVRPKNQSNINTQITDTQIVLAAENAESMLELVDDNIKWTPDQMKPNPINSNNDLNISSINFDSQWGVSPTKKSEESAENLNISYLENVDTQWFFSPDKTSQLSNKDVAKKTQNIEMKTFFGVLSFSVDGSTCLRQCNQSESNIQLRVKSNSWIFDVSCDDEDTLGFNSKYWKFYSNKFNACIESFEQQMFPENGIKVTQQKNVKKPKKPRNNKNKNRGVFKIPKGVPIKSNTKSSKNKQKNSIDYVSMEEDLYVICGSPSKVRTENKTDKDIAELLETEAESLYYIPTTNSEETKNNDSLLVSIEFKNIIDFAVISKAVTKKNQVFLKKVNELEPNIHQIKHNIDLKFTQEKQYIRNAQLENKKQNVFTFTTSGKTSEDSQELIKSKSSFSEDLDASDFVSPIEEENNSKIASLNEDHFIENVDKIIELIAEKNCSSSKNNLGKKSQKTKKSGFVVQQNEETLADLELSSPIQKEFMKEFNTSSDFGAELQQQPGFITTSGTDKKVTFDNEDFLEKVEFMKQFNLKYIGKSNKNKCNGSGGLEKISKKSNNKSDFKFNSKSKKGSTEEIDSKLSVSKKENEEELAKLNETKSSLSEELIEEFKNIPDGFVEEPPTNMFNDLRNEPKPSTSKKEEHLPEEDNISTKKFLSEIKATENSGFSFVSGRKPLTKPTNIFNDIFGNEPSTSKSKKEQQFLQELNVISDSSTENLLPEVKITANPGFSFAKKPTNIDLLGEEPKPSTSRKEELNISPQIETSKPSGFSFISEKLANISSSSKFKIEEFESNKSVEEMLPQFDLNKNSGFCFVSGKKPSTKPTNIFNDLIGKEPSSSKSKKEEQFLEGIQKMNAMPIEEIELNQNIGFSFVSDKKGPTDIFKDLFENDSETSKSKKELNNIFEDPVDGQIEIITNNPGFGFVSGKKSATKQTNIFNNELKTCNSKKEDQFLEELKNMSEDPAAEKLPPIEITEIPGFTFVSGKKPVIKKTNIFSDIFGNEPKACTSKKEDQFLEELKNMSEDPAREKLPPIENTEIPGFSFISGKKPVIKKTNIFSDIFGNEPKACTSKKEDQFLEELKNMSEDPAGEKLPPIENTDISGFSFVSGKKPIIKATNIFSDIFGNEPKACTSKKEEQFLEELKNMSEDPAGEKLPPIENTNIPGFSFVSGKKPVIKATNIFSDIFGNEPKACTSKKEGQFLEELKNLSEDPAGKKLPPIKNTEIPGFSFVSGKKPIIKATNIFSDIFGNEPKACTSKKEEQFLEELKNMSEDPAGEKLPPIENTDIPGFSFVSGKKPVIKATNIFSDIFEMDSKCAKSSKEEEFLKALETNPEPREKRVTNKTVDLLEENNNRNTIQKSYSSPALDVKDTPEDCKKKYASPLVGAKRPFNSPQISSNSSTPISKRAKLGPTNRKRSLGSATKSCRQLNLSEISAKKAKLIFEDFDVQPQDSVNFNNNILIKSPIASASKHISSTPIIQETSLLNTSISMKETNETLINNTQIKHKITPIKSVQSFDKKVPSLYAFQETETDNNKVKSLLEKKYELLKLETAVFHTRIEILNEQEKIIQHSSLEHRRQKIGCLLNEKSTNSQRISLKDLGKPKLNMGIDKTLLEISPENALHFTFFVPWWTNDNRTYPAIIRTQDGALLIPTDQNQIGINQIESGFLAMPGVDPKLVPDNWIRNHYKWIVWKFGSYERNFPTKFPGVTNLENILGQLKYRYDREIDKAQRSALKKILEADDSPSKRMVLCVSDIFRLSSRQNELELTDGWYSIKTLVDPNLNNLINSKKIHIGDKLMIHGAELLNCEGCPPLETPANVRLQIHYNSTRRAAWFCKLGYQRNPGPLCINLHTLKHQGGPVGLTLVYIARSYPISFMEHGNKIIWRDRKAERKRANEWESIQKEMIEQYLEETKTEMMREKNERLKRKKQNKILLASDVCKLQDARSLYQLWEECNDPESLTELLTEEQFNILKNHQIQEKMNEQAELAAKLRRKLEEKNIKNRNVSSVLKLLVVDVKRVHHYRILNIWRPTETHIQELKEGQCVHFYNITIKDARNLSSTPRTRFALNYNLDKTNLDKFERFERKVIPINELKNDQLFDEFDTVGFVVEVNNEDDNKYMWIVDENKLFLFIRIRSTLQVVSIFDGINPGKVVSFQNLVYQKPTQNYASAIGNCYTNLYIHPHQPYLQDSMFEFIKKLPDNKEEFLQDCELLLNTTKTENELKLNQLSTLMMYDSMIETNNTIGFKNDVITVSDEEMSLIDTQFF